MTEGQKLPSYLTGTLEQKYRIEKTNGHPVDSEAKYFVLRYDKDPNAVLAVIAYAASITGDNSRFAKRLLEMTYVHAERMDKLGEWSAAAHSLLYGCKCSMERMEALRWGEKICKEIEDHHEQKETVEES